jgi:small subunit ribosomal protein S5
LIKRVSKKTTGGNYISFTALVAVGDKKGQVGIGLQRGLEVPQAIRKAIKYARKRMVTIQLKNSSIAHDIRVKYKGSSVIIKPAPVGAGLKAGSVVRSILSLAGVANASAKILGSRNQLNNAYAVMKALELFSKRNRTSTKAFKKVRSRDLCALHYL